MRRILLVMLSTGVLGLAGLAAGANAGAEAGAATTSAVTVLPVVSCPTSYGVGSRTGVFVAKTLPATSSQRGLSFYSNGLNTVLGPAGWRCGALVAADGGQVLAVYPPGQPNYSEQIAPKGAELVQVEVDYTGHLPGGELMCGLFPHSAAASEVRVGGLPCQKAQHEHVVQLTNDIATYADPVGVTGTGAGSGGALRSLGAGVYPQVVPAPQSVDVAVLSCTLPRRDRTLCAAIESDFLIRYTPVDEGTTTDG